LETQLTEYTINSESAIAAATANMAWQVYDADSTLRTKKVTATQLGAFVGTPSGGMVVGSSTAAIGASGVMNQQVSTAGVNPGATAADNVLAVYSIPANAFSAAGKMIQFTAAGSFGATANNKRVKIIFNPSAAVVGSTVTGGTTVADTGTVATNGGGWQLQAQVTKVGAANANTQVAIHNQAQVGAAVAALLAPTTNLTATENAAILVAVTGNATTATTDIVFNFFEAFASN
jgi:hypothetical protein